MSFEYSCEAPLPQFALPDKPIAPVNKSEDWSLRFELAELETFLAVVEEGSFSRAAKRLHISQPSVTNRIKRLEDVLRVKLLVRTTRHVETTPEGRWLRTEGQRTLRGLRVVMQHFRQASETARNRVLVTATPMIAARVMPELIRSYTERFPGVQVQLRDLQHDQLMRAIAEGEADLGVTALDGGGAGRLHFSPLAQEEVVLVVPASHPLAGEERVTLMQVARHPLMFLERYTDLRQRLQRAFEALGQPFMPGTASTLPTLLGMIDAGHCLAFLPRSMAQSYARHSRRTLRIDDFQATRAYGCVVARTGGSSAVTSFQAHLASHFNEVLEANSIYP